MARILGIEIAGDYGSGPAIKEAVGDLRQFAIVSDKATASVERLAAQRANLKMLATAYNDVAASAVKGSDEQVIAAGKAAQANARLAEQTKLANAEMTASSAKARESSAAFGNLGGAAKKSEGMVSKLGSSMALWLGAPALGAGLASAIHSTQQFNAEMELLHTQAGATQSEVKRMTGALMGMASSVATGPDTLAKGLFHIESAGMRGAKALNVLRAAAEGAKLGNANLEDVTNALNAVVVSGIKGAQNYEHAMGMLNATVGAGDMRMQDLADAMGTGLPAKAAIFGVSLRDINAALAVLGDNNIRGAEAGTQLASAIRLMAAPSKVAAKELAGLGLSSTQLAEDMRSGGIVKAVADLKDRMDAMGLSAAQQAVVLTRSFGGRQSGAILILIDQLERLRQKELAVGAGAARFGSDWAAYQQQSQFATERFKAALDTLRIEVGQAVLPEFTRATKGLADWLDKMNKSGAASRDTKAALHDLVDGLKLVHGAIAGVDKVTGSFKGTLELLLALKVASTLLGWQGALVKLGGATVAAEGEVTALQGALLGLSRMAPIVVGVEVAIHRGSIEHWLSKNIPGGKVLGDSLFMYDTIWRKFTQSSGQKNTSGMSNDPMHDAGGGSVGGYRALAAQAAAQYGVPQSMFLAQINQESGFNPAAKSSAGALGIAQFMPATAAGMGVNPMDPKSALFGAARMMSQLYAKYGSWARALSAYNSGKPDAYLDPTFAKGQTSNYVKSIMGASGSPTAAQLDALGLGGSGGKHKPHKPPIVSGANEIPADLQKAIAKATAGIKTTRGETALGWVNQQQHDYEDARTALKKLVGGQSGKQAAATEKEIAVLTAKIATPPIIKGADLLPQSLLDAITNAKNNATSSTGATAKAYLVAERNLLDKARTDLKNELAGETPKQQAAIHAELDKIKTSIVGVNKSIAANLKAQAAAIKSSAATAISQGRSTITSAFSNLVNDIKGAFETETQAYIDNTLGPKFFQGSQTPLEAQLAGMQAADTASGLQDSLDAATKQLALDQADVTVSADQLAADQKAVLQAQRAIDENNLSIQATAERKQADTDYAQAVKDYQHERSDAEHSMNVALTNLGKGIANGTLTIDGPGGLTDVLSKFGVSMTDVPVDQWSSDMDTLSSATQDLALVFIAEAKALAKIGDSKDARAAAAAAAALGANITTTMTSTGAAALAGGLARGAAFHNIPALAGGGDIRRAGLAYLHPGERVQPAEVVASQGGGGSVSVTVIAPNYVGDKRDLAAALKSPQVIEAVGTAVILASRGGHIRQGDIRP